MHNSWFPHSRRMLLDNDVVVPTPVTDAVDDRDPTFRWKFDGDTTERVEGHGGTVTGTPVYAAGIIPKQTGQAANFTSGWELSPNTDGRINSGTGYSFTKRTVSFWIKPSGTSGKHIIFEQGGNANWWGVTQQGNEIINTIGETNANKGNAKSTIVADGLYHIVATVDLTLGSNQLKLYLNGELAAQGNSSVGSDLNTHTGDAVFGGADGDIPDLQNNQGVWTAFDGLVQDAAYWNEVALDESDAAAIFAAGSDPITPPEPAAWYDDRDSVLSVWDTTDLSTMRTTLNSSGAAPTAGQAVGWVGDQKGSRHLIAYSASQRALATDGLLFDGTNDGYEATGGGGLSSATLVFVYKGPISQNIIFWQSGENNTGKFGARAVNGGSQAIEGTVGGDVYVNDINRTTAGQLYATLGAGVHVLRHEEAVLTSWPNIAFGTYANNHIDGSFSPVALLDASSPSYADDLTAAIAEADRQAALM